MNIFTLKFKSYEIELGIKTRIMGILNVTPDSFSDGGEFFSIEKALEHGMRMAEEGADIIDIGGESTRPFAKAVSEEEEKKRVLPVIERLAPKINIPISIDTMKSGVAESAINAGASIINDISGLKFDPDIAKVAAKHDIPIILMHMKKTPSTMQIEPYYDDLIGEIKEFLSNAAKEAETRGVLRDKIIIDPGIGFGKTLGHNLTILKNIEEFKSINMPILIGPSRKAFIRNLLKRENEKDLNPLSPVVEKGTQSVVAAAAMNGAHILRVHNVADTKHTLKIIDAIKNAYPTPL